LPADCLRAGAENLTFVHHRSKGRLHFAQMIFAAAGASHDLECSACSEENSQRLRFLHKEAKY
jgi:hypothetical protein